MPQNLNQNPSPYSFLGIFRCVKDKKLYFLQQGCARYVEMIESEGEK